MMQKLLLQKLVIAEIQKQIEARDKARQEKNWQAADNIRKDLQSKGVKLKDSEGNSLVSFFLK